MTGWLRPVLSLLSALWLLAEWTLALPPIVRQGFWPWHAAALTHLRHETAFQLVVLDYVLTYAVAFGLSVRDARRRSRYWPLWTAAFLLATAPAMLLYWANRPRFSNTTDAGDTPPGVEPMTKRKF